MQRIGYFSIRGFWLAPLAVFVTVVVGAVGLGGWRCLGIGLGVGAAYSSIIGLIMSIVASQNQRVLVEMMHEMDSSLQLVDYSYDVWGNARLKLGSARGDWQIDIPNLYWGRRTIFRGPNELYRVIRSGPEYSAEVREMMGSAGGVSAGT
jgi:hypothetical protein